MQKSTQHICDFLDQHGKISESYVLVREIRAFLDTGAGGFSPDVKIKVWQSNVLDEPYHFTTSHHVQTPTQAGPYYPSRTCAPTEEVAISMALDSLVSFIVGAISAGHEPSESWLIPNDGF